MCAQEIGFPVVLKLLSETITHKTDVGGVKLNLGDAEAVRSAFRAIRESVAKIGPSVSGRHGSANGEASKAMS